MQVSKFDNHTKPYLNIDLAAAIFQKVFQVGVILGVYQFAYLCTIQFCLNCVISAEWDISVFFGFFN